MHTPTLNSLLAILLLALATTVSAQGFFEQFFGGNGGPQQHGPPQNAPSDAKHYAEMFDTSMSISCHVSLL